MTHMDKVTWSADDGLRCIKSAYDIDMLMTTQLDTPGSTIVKRLLSLCSQIKQPLDITIDNENFMRFFTISINEIRLLRSVKYEVDRFQRVVQAFHSQLATFPEDLHPDAVFKFQAFMDQAMKIAEARVIEANQLDKALALDHTRVNADSHLASLRGQMQAALDYVHRLAAFLPSASNWSRCVQRRIEARSCECNSHMPSLPPSPSKSPMKVN